MKARVNTLLNLRTGTPEILPNNNPNDAFLKPGDIVEIVDTIIGQEYKGNDVWHKVDTNVLVSNFGLDIDKNLFFQEKIPLSSDNNLSQKIFLKKPLNRNGKGIRIGIMDSGINIDHPSLREALLNVEVDFLSQPHSSIVTNSHGTRIAGLLVGNTSNISGLAIDSKIMGYRIADDSGNTDDAALKAAVESIVTNNTEIDVLNLSLDILPEYVSILQPSINILANRGIIIVVAGYNANLGLASNISKLKKVIPVGIFEDDEFEKYRSEGLPAEYQVAFLNRPIKTLSIPITNIEASIASSSAYTAITSGVIAKFLSNNFISPVLRFSEVKNFLNTTFWNIKQEEAFQEFKPYKNENF